MGELLKWLLPFSMPASIYGLFIMLLVLASGIIRVEEVKEAADLLLEIMPILFIPATVGLMEAWGILKDIMLPVIIVCVPGTMAVMIVTGRVTQWLIRKKGSNNESGIDVKPGDEKILKSGEDDKIGQHR